MGHPLDGIRVLEFAGLGPAPFAAMLLAQMGAHVVQVVRPGAAINPRDLLSRGRERIAINIADPAQRGRLEELAAQADVVLEGFRPGVMEGCQLGPERLCALNPRLVYVRLTGWGQEGQLAQRAGHDINYLAIAGALHPVGPAGAPPVPPLNYVGDFGGGSLYAVCGTLAALVERERSGRGQVVDAAMVDGAASMMSMYLSHQQGSRAGTGTARGEYFLDGSAPFYRCYACADDRYVAVGAIEPKFWAILTGKLGLDTPPSQAPEDWSAVSAKLEAIFTAQPLAHWMALFDGTDACVSPVLRPEDLPREPHLLARGTFAEADGQFQPAPAPRLSRSPARMLDAATQDSRSIDAVIADWSRADRLEQRNEAVHV